MQLVNRVFFIDIHEICPFLVLKSMGFGISVMPVLSFGVFLHFLCLKQFKQYWNYLYFLYKGLGLMVFSRHRERQFFDNFPCRLSCDGQLSTCTLELLCTGSDLCLATFQQRDLGQLISPHLSFLVYKMRIVIARPHRIIMRNKLVNTHEAL